MQGVDFQKLASSDKSTDYGAFNSLKKHIEKESQFMGGESGSAIVMINVGLELYIFAKLMFLQKKVIYGV